ncbi:hypothetical protein GCM10012287_57140 [Streptomyces daqingensis]|uniref:Uncharacterized protein n=1 Tax=Streptomyces daqingensis TaxID=1472640 RepID=A0ABQ2MUL2_9ACTN|nr:hypothetical protein GCM10012287_57140 [Streptomyces daqingensis]
MSRDPCRRPPAAWSSTGSRRAASPSRPPDHFKYRPAGEKEGCEINYRVEVQQRYGWGNRSGHLATFSGSGPKPFGRDRAPAAITHPHSSGTVRDFDVSGPSAQVTARS